MPLPRSESEITADPADVDEYLREPKGVISIGPDDGAHRMRLEERLFEQAALRGYRPVYLAPLGYASTYSRGHHAAGDRTYAFQDRGGRDLALTSDAIPSVLRLLHHRRLAEERVVFSCPLFRYRRLPLRHYHHMGVAELVRMASPDAAATAEAVKRLLDVIVASLPQPMIAHFNDHALWREVLTPIAPTHDAGSELLHALSRQKPEDVAHWLSDRGAPRDAVVLAEWSCEHAASDVTGAACDELVARLGASQRTRVQLALDVARTVAGRGGGWKARLALLDFHASEFHDGLAYNLRLDDDDHHGMGDGGSYGAFASTFLGSECQFFSAVLTLERLFREIPHQREPAATVLVRTVGMGEQRRIAASLACELREAGVSVYMTDGRRMLPAELRLADHLGIRLVAVVGAREVEQGRVSVRGPDRQVRELPPDEARSWLLERAAEAR